MNNLSKALINGDKRALAKAITLIESSREDHQNKAQDIIKETLSKTGQSIRIGISGVPGVGKSTFIEALGLHILNNGHKLAVLTVDPSSPLTGGSILGDKTRMEKLSQEQNAFIRPSPTSGAMGGVADKTREAVLLCEAAGHDIILIETVGVGQSEYEVSNMVDLFLVLMLPNAGDELQGIKKGILELADLLIVNKADGENIPIASLAKNEYSNALNLTGKDNVKVLTCSSLENKGVDLVLQEILNKSEDLKSSGEFQRRRGQQDLKWFDHLLKNRIWKKIEQSSKTQKVWTSIKNDIEIGKTNVYSATEQIINSIFS